MVESSRVFEGLLHQKEAYPNLLLCVFYESFAAFSRFFIIKNFCCFTCHLISHKQIKVQKVFLLRFVALFFSVESRVD